jgi:hypothetical protein
MRHRSGAFFSGQGLFRLSAGIKLRSFIEKSASFCIIFRRVEGDCRSVVLTVDISVTHAWQKLPILNEWHLGHAEAGRLKALGLKING